MEFWSEEKKRSQRNIVNAISSNNYSIIGLEFSHEDLRHFEEGEVVITPGRCGGAGYVRSGDSLIMR